MDRIPISGLPDQDEQQATGDVARIFEDMRREMDMPFVTNLFKTLALSPRILEGTWEMYRRVGLQTTLPQSLASMINFSVSAANNCHYCNSLHTVICKMVGIDDDTLTALNSDLEALAPQRVREVVKFAVKVGTDPQSLTTDDYDRLRDQGISDEEILEIIMLAAWGTFADRIADSLKVVLEPAFKQALEG